MSSAAQSQAKGAKGRGSKRAGKWRGSVRVVEVWDVVCAADPEQEGDVCVRRCEACWWAVVHVDVKIGYGCGMACEAGVL